MWIVIIILFLVPAIFYFSVHWGRDENRGSYKYNGIPKKHTEDDRKSGEDNGYNKPKRADYYRSDEEEKPPKDFMGTVYVILIAVVIFALIIGAFLLQDMMFAGF